MTLAPLLPLQRAIQKGFSITTHRSLSAAYTTVEGDEVNAYPWIAVDSIQTYSMAILKAVVEGDWTHNTYKPMTDLSLQANMLAVNDIVQTLLPIYRRPVLVTHREGVKHDHPLAPTESLAWVKQGSRQYKADPSAWTLCFKESPKLIRIDVYTGVS